MSNSIFASFICFIFSISTAFGQLAMGKWNTHFSYNSVSQAVVSDTKVFAVSDGALFSLDKVDESIDVYSKVTGLSSTNIAKIAFDKSNNSLLIFYSNGNIDVLGANGVKNIPDLFIKQMNSSKTINHILFYNNKAYLSSDFGIIVLDVKKKEVADTYIIGPNSSEIKVIGTTVHNGIVYALNPNTIYKAQVDNPNLVNYEYWTTVNNLPGFGVLQSIVSFSDNLFLLRGGKIFKQEIDNTWSPFMSEISALNISVSNDRLLLFSGNKTFLFDSNLEQAQTEISYSEPILDGQLDNDNNTFWFAGNIKGLVSFNKVTSSFKDYKPSGPASNFSWEIAASNKKMIAVQGGRWGAQYSRSGDVMIYEDNIWTNIYAKTINEITKRPVLDFMNIAFDPKDNKHFFVTSYGTGLYEFRNNTFYKLHNHTNSTIQGHPEVPNDPWNYTRLDGAIFDQKGNLFLNNCAVSASIKVLLENGNWTELKYPNSVKETYGKIIINNQNPNQKWSISVRGGEVLVFDDNGTIEDQKDDKSRVFVSYPDPEGSGGTISNGANFTIAQDKNGVIWLGTEAGPLVFNNTSNVFNPAYTCSKIKIPRNDGTNGADFLLANEKIKAIAIDGANRKWIGTELSGVFLMSENGQETIRHFTTSNSPLLSNDILSITINQATGEVFFGTSLGLISYQSDAADGALKFEKVYAYPNPVRENYTGVITIAGLMDNTQVKITDIKGNLICQTVSNGSLATWDAKTANGKKVSTGIYLAICVNPDGTEGTITKIMVIN